MKDEVKLTLEIDSYSLSNEEGDTPNIDLKGALGDIERELRMLNKSLIKEREIINEVCDFVEKILGKLKMSLNIPIKKAPLFNNAHRLILDDKGHFIIFYENGKTYSAPLRNYPPNVIAHVLIAAMPEIAEAIADYRIKVDSRISLFHRIKKELKKFLDNLTGGI